MGEPNIPIDKALMQSAAFLELLGRLKRHSEEHQRDHWSAPAVRLLSAKSYPQICRLVCLMSLAVEQSNPWQS